MSARFERESSRSSSGVALSRLLVMPESDPVGAVVLVHGLGDHVARHEGVLREFAGRDIASVATDLPGHGKSGNPRGHIESLEEAGALIDDALQRALEIAPPGRIGLAAHSMGALVALDYFARGGGDGFGFVWLSSALVDPRYRQPAWRVSIGRWLERLLPRLRVASGVRMDECYDPKAVGISRQEERDSGTHNRMSLRLGMELLRAAERVQGAAGKLFGSQSLLMTHGDGDRVCPEPTARALFAKIAAADKTFLTFPTGAHEPWRDPEVVSEVCDWFEARLKRVDEAQI